MMNNYLKNLGKLLEEYLDGSITFEEFLDRDSLKGEAKELKDDELVRLIWHAIFQYKNDVDCSDEEHIGRINRWMRIISRQLVAGDPSIRDSLNTYFNDPTKMS